MWTLVHLVVLTGIGLQLAHTFGAKLPLDEWQIKVLTTADAMFGVVAPKIYYELEKRRLREEAPPGEADRYIQAAKRESFAYFLGAVLAAGAVGLQFAEAAGMQWVWEDHVVNVLGGTAAITTLVGLLLIEYPRRIKEERGKMTHTYTRLHVGLMTMAAVISLAIVTSQLVGAFFKTPVPKEKEMALLTAGSALLGPLALWPAYQRDKEQWKFPPPPA
jgi:hypothetical protein